MAASSRDLISLRLYSSEKAGVIRRALVAREVNGYVEAVVNLTEVKIRFNIC